MLRIIGRFSLVTNVTRVTIIRANSANRMSLWMKFSSENADENAAEEPL